MSLVEIKVKKGVPQEMNEGDDPTFEKWMDRVDRLLYRHIGVTSDCLPDCCYRDWYDERLRPVWAANRALENAQE